MCGPDNFGNEGTAHGLSAIPKFPYVLHGSLGVWCHLLQLKEPCGKHYRIFGNNGEKVVGLKLLCLYVFQSNEDSSSFLMLCSLMLLWKPPLKKLCTFQESRHEFFYIFENFEKIIGKK